MQGRRRPLLKPPGGVPIIGVPKYADKITFNLAGYDVHPPAGFDQTFIILCAFVAGANSEACAVLGSVGVRFFAFLAADNQNGHDGPLGNRGTQVYFHLDPDGGVVVSAQDDKSPPPSH